jgi:DNA-binding transcriptional MerR regulator
MQEFTRKELEEILGIPARRIQFYTDEELLVPEVENPKGRGTTRRYSKFNLLELLIVRELSNSGVQLVKLKEILGKLRELVKAGCRLWDPQKENVTGGGGKLIVYNPQSESCILAVTSGAARLVTLDMGRYTSALVVDIGNLIAGIRCFR